MPTNSGLNVAKKSKSDEFYTMYSDVEKELQHYKQHFKDKTVYCNCDTTNSAFWKYFCNNFESLGLKKLISTYYSPDFNAYKTEYCGGEETREKLQWNGDFRTPECQTLLDECDIVCTNPPFSLFREYFDQLIEYRKRFIIMGPMMALLYTNIFHLFKKNGVWLGASIHSGDRAFYVPDDYPLMAYGCGIDENGNKWIRVKGVRWFTNLDYPEKYKKLILCKEYNEAIYPVYDNYDAINVNKTAEIPEDYYGIMGVPITFMDKYNPEQFEIVGLPTSLKLNGKEIFARILIRRKGDYSL